MTADLPHINSDIVNFIANYLPYDRQILTVTDLRPAMRSQRSNRFERQ